MKALLQPRYGAPDVLRLGDVETPTPKADEVLVRIEASAVNAADLDQLRGKFIVRLGAPFRPLYPILGSDLAGRVAAIGEHITRFQVGDEVYADSTECGFGAFAQYKAVPEPVLGHKPANLSFEEAAAVPSAGVIALQALRAPQPLQAGQRLLINGAGGGVGTFLIQLAKRVGAHVTAVDTAAKSGMLYELGADEVIDYTTTDFTKTGQTYDRIVDVVANRPLSAYRRALTANGSFTLIGGTFSVIMQTFFIGGWLSKRTPQHLGVLMLRTNAEDLDHLKTLIEAGHLRPIIDRRYPFENTADALAYLESGHAIGKIVIQSPQHIA